MFAYAPARQCTAVFGYAKRTGRSAHGALLSHASVNEITKCFEKSRHLFPPCKRDSGTRYRILRCTCKRFILSLSVFSAFVKSFGKMSDFFTPPHIRPRLGKAAFLHLGVFALFRTACKIRKQDFIIRNGAQAHRKVPSRLSRFNRTRLISP